MAQIFHPASNPFSKASIFGALFLLGGFVWLCAEIYESPYMTDATVVREQPVPFSHDHHVSGLGIDCRYCHTTADKGPFAGLPPTRTCMTCHSQVWTEAAMLEPVRESFRTGKPIPWVRVTDLPDFVYFDHSIHVAKGVQCAECHGPVERMPLTWKQLPFHMADCLACHRRPQDYLDSLKLDEKAKALKVRQLTNCSVCHR